MVWRHRKTTETESFDRGKTVRSQIIPDKLQSFEQVMREKSGWPSALQTGIEVYRLQIPAMGKSLDYRYLAIFIARYLYSYK